jgi:hypothetical protein
MRYIACIDWILESQLVSQPGFRRSSIRLLENRLRLDSEINSLSNLPLNCIFDDVCNFRIELDDYISDLNKLLGFELDKNDKLLQIIIFLFLRNTQNKYPDTDSWVAFCQRTRESQREETIRDLRMMWLNIMQSHILEITG